MAVQSNEVAKLFPIHLGFPIWIVANLREHIIYEPLTRQSAVTLFSVGVFCSRLKSVILENRHAYGTRHNRLDGVTLVHDTANSSPIASLTDRFWHVISRTPETDGIALDNQVDPGLKLPLSDDRTLELLDTLIENASRFATATIRVTGYKDHSGLHLAIEDDGPGIPVAERDRALRRGQRLDEQRGQHGLGLSIANTIVEASGGYLELRTSPMGGLSVQMIWPVGASQKTLHKV